MENNNSIEDFKKNHLLQLESLGISQNESLLQKLHHKLIHSIYDAGKVFQIMDNQEIEAYQLAAQTSLKKNEDIFLIDHFYTFKQNELRNQLETKEALFKRLSSMLQHYLGETKVTLSNSLRKSNQYKENVEFESMNITDPLTLEFDFHNTICLSLISNDINDFEPIHNLIIKCPNLKGLWINDNPLLTHQAEEVLLFHIDTEFQNIEIFNKKFTRNAGDWGLLYSAYNGDFDAMKSASIDKIRYLNVSGRNIYRIKNREIFKKMTKLKILDARDTFFDSLEQANIFLGEILKQFAAIEKLILDPYMLDLFFKISKNLPNICPTLRYINEYDIKFCQPSEKDIEVNALVKNIWKIAHSYQIKTANFENSSLIWYIMDEVGSSITHSITPNFVCVPFLYAPDGKLNSSTTCAYSLLWPAEDINEGDVIFANLYPNHNEKMSGLFADIPEKSNWIELFYQAVGAATNILHSTELPKEEKQCPPENISLKQLQEIGVKIATNDSVIHENLKNTKNFVVTNNMKEADLIWFQNISYQTFIKNQDQIAGKYINLPLKQLSRCSISKHLITKYGYAKWFQKSYSLKDNLELFLGDFMTRKYDYKNNFWIIKGDKNSYIKPTISNNLDYFLNLASTDEELIAQLYIHKPLRIEGSKFSVTYFALICSTAPLRVCLLKDFLIKVTPNDFTMDARKIDLKDTHFSSAKYSKGTKAFMQTYEKVTGSSFFKTFDQVPKLVAQSLQAIHENGGFDSSSPIKTIFELEFLANTKHQISLINVEILSKPDNINQINPTLLGEAFSILMTPVEELKEDANYSILIQN